MINAVILQHRHDLDMIECLFSVDPASVEKLEAAFFDETNRTFSLWDGENGIWACGYLNTPSDIFELGGDRKTGEIRLAVGPTCDPLDPSALPDLETEWFRFVQPIKRVMELMK